MSWTKKQNEETDYMTKLDNIRDSLNEAIKKCFENEGRFINEEVLQWQKKFDSECLKYYYGK